MSRRLPFWNPKVLGCRTSKQEVGEHYKEQSVHRQLRNGVKRAENYVRSDPNDCKPARPIPALQHVYPSHNCEKTDNQKPCRFIVERVLNLELGEVVRHPHHASRYEHETNDGD